MTISILDARACIALGLLTSLSGAIPSQATRADAGHGTETPKPGRAAVEALKAAAMSGVRFEGRVNRTEPPSGFGGSRIILAGGASGAGTPFTGVIEVLRTEDRELLVVSRTRVPGVAHFDDGDISLTQTLVGSQSIDASSLTSELTQLLDLERLMRALDDSEISASDPDELGHVSYTARLPERYIKGSGGMLASFEPKVLEIETRLVLDDKNQLSKVTFHVVHSDPTAAMRHRAMNGGPDAGAFKVADLDDVGDGDKAEGETVSYKLEVVDADPSEHAARMLAMLRQTAEQERLR